jgi:hypothetical protein
MDFHRYGLRAAIPPKCYGAARFGHQYDECERPGGFAQIVGALATPKQLAHAVIQKSRAGPDSTPNPARTQRDTCIRVQLDGSSTPWIRVRLDECLQVFIAPLARSTVVFDHTVVVVYAVVLGVV